MNITSFKYEKNVSVNDDLIDIIEGTITNNNVILQDGDIIVVAQKIVSKAEGRYLNLHNISPSKRAKEIAEISQKDPRFIEAVLSESESVLRVKPGVIIVRHKLGFVCANAGIDHSNVGGIGREDGDWVLLLPKNPDKSAENLRLGLERRLGNKIGVVINDSHGRAWRLGTVGVAIGISRVPALVDLRGRKDLFGYVLNTTQISAADEIAAAASLLMGQANEGTPIVHIRGFPYPLQDSNIKELIRPKDQDLFL